jgi:hypothetical protein
VKAGTDEYFSYGDVFPLRNLFGRKELSATFVRNADEFERERLRLSRPGKTSAIYWPQQYDRLLPDILVHAESWINSPLTDRLRNVLRPGFYLRALVYLCELAFSNTAAINADGLALWQAVDEKYEGVTVEQARRMVAL